VAAAAEEAGAPGGNAQAIAIAELQDTGTMNGGKTTFDDYYNALVSQVGIDVNTVSDNYDQQNAMVGYLTSYRESISGVSLDEEMVNLVKYQHAYEAAAKLIANVDDMMTTIIGMV
jgi:flagellar hook-associated protein 1 FlgK